jgi:hypothetical protein
LIVANANQKGVGKTTTAINPTGRAGLLGTVFDLGVKQYKQGGSLR